jgi:hypothetical protein
VICSGWRCRSGSPTRWRPRPPAGGGPFVSHLAAALHLQKVLHADETPARVGGQLNKLRGTGRGQRYPRKEMIKRQRCGRAKLDLLRKRILASP